MSRHSIRTHEYTDGRTADANSVQIPAASIVTNCMHAMHTNAHRCSACAFVEYIDDMQYTNANVYINAIYLCSVRHDTPPVSVCAELCG